MAEDTAGQFLSDSGVDFLQIVVDRADVESGSTETTLRLLQRLFETTETVKRFRGSVEVVFHGYNDDLRELYEIEEVCRYLILLDQVFPYWFYFASLEGQLLILLMIVECKHQKTPDGLVMNDKYQRAMFLERHFSAMNSIFEKYGFDESLNEALSKAIINYYEKRAEALRIN
jgi:hypothetical protein